MKRSVYSASWCNGSTRVFGSLGGGSSPSEATEYFKASPVKLKKEKVNKYRNKKTIIDGIEFDSVKEGKRYLVLKKAQTDGLISELTLQPHWDAMPAKKETYVEHLKTKDKIKERTIVQPIKYTADFSYIKDGQLVVEDVKPCPHLVSRDCPLRIKLMKYFHDIDVKLIYSETAPI